MAQGIFFGATTLNVGKKGELPVDEYGYRTVPLGGLDVYNESGIFYKPDEAKDLFLPGGDFYRRVESQCLKGEEGHPIMMPGMSDDAWIDRMLTIHEPNTSFHIAQCWLDPDAIKDDRGRTILAIMGKVKGSGALGPAYEADMANPRVEVCHSIRAFSEEFMVGRQVVRILREVVTFDRVTEPGIRIARKSRSPAMEALLNKQGRAYALEERQINIDDVYRAVETRKKRAQSTGVAMEANFFTPEKLFSMMAGKKPSVASSAAMRWAMR